MLFGDPLKKCHLNPLPHHFTLFQLQTFCGIIKWFSTGILELCRFINCTTKNHWFFAESSSQIITHRVDGIWCQGEQCNLLQGGDPAKRLFHFLGKTANARSNLGMAWLVRQSTSKSCTIDQLTIHKPFALETSTAKVVLCNPSHSQSKIVVGKFCNVRHNAGVTLNEGLVWIYLGWTVLNISVDFVILSWHNPCYPYPLHHPKLTSMHCKFLVAKSGFSCQKT